VPAAAEALADPASTATSDLFFTPTPRGTWPVPCAFSTATKRAEWRFLSDFSLCKGQLAMRFNTRSRCCGERISPKKEKLAVVLGGAGAVALMGMFLATPVGWAAVLPAAFAGSASAKKILEMKMKLMHCSHKAGSYFVCSDCGRDIPLGEVFAD
jgi:hypothetical protein